MTINFIQSVPFIHGHRIVVSGLGGDIDSDDTGTLVIEAYNAILDDWLPVRMFPCSSRPEALGIAVTFAAQVLNHIDMDALAVRMSNRRMNLPGGLLISLIDTGDGSYLAAVESRDAQGVVTVTEYRDDARNFFEAYGWALAEATMASRRNGEDRSF
jgi:hypothetical protein